MMVFREDMLFGDDIPIGEAMLYSKVYCCFQLYTLRLPKFIRFYPHNISNDSRSSKFFHSS